MSNFLGRVLANSIIRSVGATAEELTDERRIREYLEIYSVKFRHSVKIDPRALPHYRFHLVRGRDKRLLGGFVVHANKEFNRTLSLAPKHVASHPALGGELSELCMLFKGDRVSKIESGALLLLGVKSAAALAPTIVCVAVEQKTFDIYRRYIPHVAFEGTSPTLNCRVWVVYSGRDEFYYNVLTAAPSDVLMRVLRKQTYRRTRTHVACLDPNSAMTFGSRDSCADLSHRSG